jgi:chromosome segregation ATPase
MYWPAINSIIILCLTVIFILAFNQLTRKLANKQTDLDSLKLKVDELAEQVTVYENITNRQQQQISELSNNLTTCFSPLENLENRIEEVASIIQLVQSDMSSESTEQKLYGRAKKMIEMGADINELVAECEIPRAEAELLISLYKS